MVCSYRKHCLCRIPQLHIPNILLRGRPEQQHEAKKQIAFLNGREEDGPFGEKFCEYAPGTPYIHCIAAAVVRRCEEELRRTVRECAYNRGIHARAADRVVEVA